MVTTAWRMCYGSLKVDNLWGKINIVYLIEDTENSQFFKSVVVYIGWRFIYYNINYYSLELNFELQIVKWSADILCKSQVIYSSRNLWLLQI